MSASPKLVVLAGPAALVMAAGVLGFGLSRLM
jgi:hypothetical protein